ncbi:hypothetical protein Aple_099550 [Acrocarpospora pleiomorpha]|uniref:Uncharacterized protein n=1 Tax=Acrocarpospora pleiomorpha TaxID=90975 RepID=A0A5M3Y1H6_9ACTN|nr:hypothetical protein Aple_099550 [Acrocarpospora pleiomorpha]
MEIPDAKQATPESRAMTLPSVFTQGVNSILDPVEDLPNFFVAKHACSEATLVADAVEIAVAPTAAKVAVTAATTTAGFTHAVLPIDPSPLRSVFRPIQATAVDDARHGRGGPRAPSRYPSVII